MPRDPTVCYSDGYRLLKTSGPGVSPENVFSRRPANQEVNLTNQPLREQYQPTWQQDQPIKVERFPEINQGNWRWCLHGVCLPYRGPRTDCTQNTVLELLLLAHIIMYNSRSIFFSFLSHFAENPCLQECTQHWMPPSPYFESWWSNDTALWATERCVTSLTSQHSAIKR